MDPELMSIHLAHEAKRWDVMIDRLEQYLTAKQKANMTKHDELKKKITIKKTKTLKDANLENMPDEEEEE